MTPLLPCRAGIAALLVVTAAGAAAGTTDCKSRLIGVNLAGAEFAPHRLPGHYGREYRFPIEAQFRYYRAAGFNAVRLPILWERLQPKLFGELDHDYLGGISNSLDLAASQHMRLVVDLHNYARYQGKLIGEQEVGVAAFQDVWRRLAKELRGHPALEAYGLMNEPYNTQGQWERWAQAGVDAVRELDRRTRLYIAGDSFSNAHRWPTTHPKPFVVDPQGLESYEAHLYFDRDYSGRYQEEVPPSDQASAVRRKTAGFQAWLRRYDKRGVIGEWGVPTGNLDWSPSVYEFLKFAGQACMDTYMWAGGAWSPGYRLSLEPTGGGDKPIVSELRALLGAQGTREEAVQR